MKADSNSASSTSLPVLGCALALVKFRLLSLVLVSAGMGYFLGFEPGSPLAGLGLTILGIALVGGGANCLNQVMERDADARMLRTRTRPLVTGRTTPATALAFGLALSGAGLLVLALQVNALTAWLGFLSWTSYLCLYTPLKRRTALNTWIGAIPGALPAVLGYSGAANALDATALALFMLLYVWQLPHFFAISWLHREDYLRGGFRMLSWNDAGGERSARQILLHSLLLLPISALLYLVAANGLLYLFVALGASLVQLQLAWRFRQQPDPAAARRVFHFTILYLPLLFLGSVLDRSFSLL